MKLFTLYNNNILSDNNQAVQAFNKSDGVQIVTTPDTALTKDGRPFFVPDFTEACTFIPAFVVRISRLGHSISQRFAHRYYDAITAGVRFAASDLLRQARKQGLPWSFATGFDGAAAIGKFISLDEATDFVLRLCVDGDEVETVDGTGLRDLADTAVAHISCYYTLRQGDLLFFCKEDACCGQKARINSHISAEIGGRNLLAFNIK